MIVDKTGQRFGNLLVAGFAYANKGRSYWNCQCDCGNKVVVKGVYLVSGDRSSCGCLRKLSNARNLVKARENSPKRHKGVSTVENDIYVNRKKGAEARGHDFKLSKASFVELIHQPCYYCGGVDQRQNRTTKEVFDLNGVDRVDNSIGYIEGNCVPCCSMCNYAKKDNSHSAFLSWVRRVFIYTNPTLTRT